MNGRRAGERPGRILARSFSPVKHFRAVRDLDVGGPPGPEEHAPSGRTGARRGIPSGDAGQGLRPARRPWEEAAMAATRRQLKFGSLAEVSPDVERLLRGHVTVG